MKYILSLLALIAAGTLAAQSPKPEKSGFYGKKIVVDVSALGRIPLWNNTNANNKSAFNPGFTIGFTSAVSNRVSIGAEMCTQYNSFDSQKYLDEIQQDSVTITYHDKIRYHATSVLFKVEIHSQNKAPYGFSHVIAVGPTFSHCVDKNYLSSQQIDPDYYYYNNGSPGVHQHQDFNTKDVGLTFMYAFTVRHAITESLWLNYGVRTTLNLPVSGGGIIGSIIGNTYDHGVQTAIEQSQLRNVFSARIGLSYAF